MSLTNWQIISLLIILIGFLAVFFMLVWHLIKLIKDDEDWGKRILAIYLQIISPIFLPILIYHLIIIQLCKYIVFELFPGMVAFIWMKQYFEFVLTENHGTPFLLNAHFFTCKWTLHNFNFIYGYFIGCTAIWKEIQTALMFTLPIFSFIVVKCKVKSLFPDSYILIPMELLCWNHYRLLIKEHSRCELQLLQ